MSKFKTHDDILKSIEEFAATNGISILDAILDYCFKNELDPAHFGESIKHKISLKRKIQVEAKAIKMIK